MWKKISFILLKMLIFNFLINCYFLQNLVVQVQEIRLVFLKKSGKKVGAEPKGNGHALKLFGILLAGAVVFLLRMVANWHIQFMHNFTLE